MLMEPLVVVGGGSEEASIGESLWWAMEGALLVKISWGSSHQLNGEPEQSMDKKTKSAVVLLAVQCT